MGGIRVCAIQSSAIEGWRGRGNFLRAVQWEFCLGGMMPVRVLFVCSRGDWRMDTIDDKLERSLVFFFWVLWSCVMMLRGLPRKLYVRGRFDL